MAHKETIRNTEIKAALPGMNHIYTVSTNVGYGCKNMKEDVRLVQFFINAVAKDMGPVWPRRPATLVTDGIFGGKTWGAVKNFQQFVSAVTDGMVSPVDGVRLVGRRQKLVYTMYYLNWYYWMSRPNYLIDLRNDPELPAELKAYFASPLPNLV